jgi:hypothetical protein
LTQSSKHALEQLHRLPSRLEICLNDLLSQNIQVVEFRAQLNEAKTICLAALDLDIVDLGGELSKLGRNDPAISCVRWPKRLQDAIQELQLAFGILEQFWSDGRLADLDQAIAKLRASDYAMQEALGPRQTESPHRDLHQNLKVQRWNQITRAVFSCTQCGWELGYSREIEADEFLDVELEQFECPLCAQKTEQLQ